MLDCRLVAYDVLAGLEKFEREAGDVRKWIEEYLDSEDPRVRQKIDSMAREDIFDIVSKILEGVARLRGEYRLFTKVAASTSKGNQVTNVMAYKRRDAIKHITREYEAMRRLVRVVDVEMPILQQPK